MISCGKYFSYKIKVTTLKVKFYDDSLHLVYILISYNQKDNLSLMSTIFAVVKYVISNELDQLLKSTVIRTFVSLTSYCHSEIQV